MKRCLLTLLFVVCMLPFLFVRAAADAPENVPQDPNIISLADDTTYMGYFRDASSFHVYRIEVFETSMAAFTETKNEVTDYTVAVYGMNQKKIQEKAVNGKGSTARFYLLPGTYYVGFFPHGQFPGNYYFNYAKHRTFDSFEETQSDHNNFASTADSVILNKTYTGTLCANETKTIVNGANGVYDVYRFKVPFTYSSVRLDFKSDMSHVNIMIANVDTPSTPYKTHDCVSAGGYGHITHMEFNDIIAPGEYYLYIYDATGRGGYEFTLQYDTRITKDYGTVYTTVGQQRTLSGMPSGSGYFEYDNPGVVSISGNRLKSLKAGTSDVTGYFTDSTKAVSIHSVVEFKDVIHGTSGGANPYYYDAVYWAADEGITMGVMNRNGVYETFNPSGQCTRAQTITMLWRMAGCPKTNCSVYYPDVKETDYFYTAVAWGIEKGIVKGYPDGTFKPQNVCTRAQAITFLYRYAKSPEVTPDASTAFNDIDYTDGNYYNDAVIWAIKHEITFGYSADNTFRPQNKCTRAQMVTFLQRYDNNCVRKAR